MSDQPDQKLPTFKLIVVGESGVGKTNILTQYLKGKFVFNQPATIGMEFASKIVTLQGEKVKFMLWDTAGQDRYRALASVFYRGAVGALMVFDLTARQTFEKLDRWITQVKEQAANSIQTIMLIGNKSDLPNRSVTTDEALTFAEQHQMAYMEVSACTGKNITTALQQLMNEVFTLSKKSVSQIIVKPAPVKKALIEIAKTQQQTKKKSTCCPD